jgi:Domain of unknown function (DUF4180)
MAEWSECAGSIRQPTDVLEWVASGSDALLVEAHQLPPEFFDLRTGFAGELLQKIQNYGLRVAAVFPSEEGYTQRFKEFLLEARRGPRFRAFAAREDAERWLAGS